MPNDWKTLFRRANQLLRATTHPAAVRLPVEGLLPSLAGAIDWLNSPPLTAAGLQGHVVLIDFWTYTCINWLRTLPYLRAWAEKYKDNGLLLIGVHTPEFDVEHDLDNVRRAVKNLRVDYPVAVDNDYAIWSAFDNHYCPALYFVDTQRQIRHHRFGEGGYEESEMILQQLLSNAGITSIRRDLVSVEARGAEAAADWDSLRSPENYLGYQRTENFASSNGALVETPHIYVAPERLQLNNGRLPVTGRYRSRTRYSTTPAGGSSTASMRATCTWSWNRQRRVLLCGSTCVSTGDPREPPTGPTLTTKATARQPNRASTSSSASQGQSASGPSRSRSSTQASTPTPSPSAKSATGTRRYPSARPKADEDSA
jgi:thiol-disulfide isomerase/thioredoxin